MRRWGWMWVVSGCSGAMLGPDGSLADGDGDGWAVADGDCDDAAADVHPTAEDFPGDGVDQDCDGGDAVGLSIRRVAPGDLRITEFLADPLAALGGNGEWVELQNLLEQPVDLKQLVLTDGERDRSVLTVSYVVQPGDFVVLGAVADPEANGGVAVDLLWSDFGLSNDLDRIVLAFEGVVFDEVAFDGLGPVAEGVSTSRDADGDGAWPTGWCLGSGAYGYGGEGTPGAANPPCPDPFEGRTAAELEGGELLITEILQAPLQVDGDFGEWVELHNTTGDAIDLKGLSLVDEGGDRVDVEASVVVPAGGYAVLASSADPARNGGLDVDWAWGFDYGLKNSGQAVILAHGTVELDRVEYDNGATFPDPEGASMSLDPSAFDVDGNDLGANWCEGTSRYGDGDRGTPGEANPPC